MQAEASITTPTPADQRRRRQNGAAARSAGRSITGHH